MGVVRSCDSPRSSTFHAPTLYENLPEDRVEVPEPEVEPPRLPDPHSTDVNEVTDGFQESVLSFRPSCVEGE